MKFNAEELQLRVTIESMTENYNKKEQANTKTLKEILERKISEGNEPEAEAKMLIDALVRTGVDYAMFVAIVTGEEVDLNKLHNELNDSMNSLYKEAIENGSEVMNEIEDLIEALAQTQADVEILHEIIGEDFEKLDEDIKFGLMLATLARL